MDPLLSGAGELALTGRQLLAGERIEHHLYAEDPAAGWRPRTGTLHTFAVPGVSTSFATSDRSAGIRLDSGVTHGSTISLYQDPMLAKIVAWGTDREQARSLLADALSRATIHGPRTNRDLLVAILTHPAFRSVDTTTAFFEQYGLDRLSEPLLDEHTEALAAIAAALAEDARVADRTDVHGDLPSGWRNVPSQPQRVELAGDRGPHRVEFRFQRGRLIVEHRPELLLLGFDSPRRLHLHRSEARN